MRTSLPREVLEEPEVEGTPEAGVAAYQGGPQPVAGVLEKWVNYGKGWRPRWFVLERGLLSYYKLHGPDKVSIAEERARHAALQILGKETIKEERRSERTSGGGTPRALGSVHMMLASIRESAADEKKFYVHTGTKTLHLRAQSREDRAQWLQQLRLAKDKFRDQRGLLPPAGTSVQDSLKETLEKVGVVLKGEGVNLEKVDAVEVLVREEAAGWQERLQAEREKRRLLLEYVRTLEADKVELETAGGVTCLLIEPSSLLLGTKNGSIIGNKTGSVRTFMVLRRFWMRCVQKVMLLIEELRKSASGIRMQVQEGYCLRNGGCLEPFERDLLLTASWRCSFGGADACMFESCFSVVQWASAPRLRLAFSIVSSFAEKY
jgi:hypothetical protein